MKVEVLKVFFDANGLHKVGEVAEVDFFDPEMMKEIEEKPTKPAKKEPKK